jgi:formylglycine-generating enzyme required for sulfatase activity/cytochrome c553
MRAPAACLAACALALLAAPGVRAGEAGWADDLLAARAALWPSGAPARSAVSPVLKADQPAEHLELDVAGVDVLWLTTQGVPDYAGAWTAWCEPELLKPDGTAVRLTALKPVHAAVGWGRLLVDRDLHDAPLQVKGRPFAFGFWAHADSTLGFKLDRKFTRFRAWVGLTGSPVPVGGRFTATDALPPRVAAGRAAQDMERRHPPEGPLARRLLDAWASTTPDAAGTQAFVTTFAASAKKTAPAFLERAAALRAAAAPEAEWLRLAADIAAADTRRARLLRRLDRLDPAALRRAVDDLAATFPDAYPAKAVRERLAALPPDPAALRAGVAESDPAALAAAEAWLALQADALLANPLLDFDRLLLVRRRADAPRLGLPNNWESNCVLPRAGYGNDIAVLSPVSPAGTLATLYRPEDDGFVGDVELHPGAGRLMFSRSAPRKPWQVWELATDGTGLRQVTPDMGADVDNYDPCYLPGGDILFTSTATMVAVPCVNGSANVANLYRLSADGKTVRQLCFDQEHNWCPTVLNNGRVLYLRWEYADLPHSNSRRLFHMNPDGTGQMAYYGSNSYWPNGVFYARPVPGHPTLVAGIVTGHHGVPRMGELVLFDPQKGRFEAEGAVQRIPGFGKKVERVVKDCVADASWPKFLHPLPLGRDDGTGSGKYFLAACQPTPDSLWGLYLVDVFDNLLLLKEEPGFALLEPLPVQKRPAPPVIPDRVDPASRDARVYLADIYSGPGLAGIPRGEVRALRVFTYVYGYRGMGGLYGTVGMNGPWDMRRVLGTVPVEEDGSAFFRIPANTPIAVQPLDREGKALQLMRSWFTGMPGEVISCVGCHEAQNTSPPLRPTLAAVKPPTDLASWYGRTRGFAFAREVQPVLDAKCVACHDAAASGPEAAPRLSLRGDRPMPAWSSKLPGRQNAEWGGKFSLAYATLHRFVRHPGIESDMHLLTPMDFHADGTELVQILRKGHYGVTLTPEEWDRLVTWIDLNTPFHGDWSTVAGEAAVQRERRRAELRRMYANVDEFQIDPPAAAASAPAPSPAVPERRPAEPPAAASPPPAATGRPAQSVDLGGGVRMTFVYLPPGEFVMGSAGGPPDEQPAGRVPVRRGFWMAVTETTNEQFRTFDPAHDSRREHVQGYQFGMEGYPLFTPRQPAVRVAWSRASAFCDWLSARTGLKAALPTEAQWEYACRAGTTTPFSYGGLDADFSAHANLADRTTREFACDTYLHDRIVPLPDPTESDDWLPKDARFNDGALVSAEAGRYRPNPWGLHDLHGNVWEWTRSEVRPYPYADDDGRNRPDGDAPRVVRGGSWRDRPQRATASYRLAYRPYQPAVNVGFRVIIDEDRPALAATEGGVR